MENQMIFGSIGLGRLGDASPDWWGGTTAPATTAPAPAPTTSFLDKINNVLSTGSKIVTSGSTILSTVKSAIPGSSSNGQPSAVVNPVPGGGSSAPSPAAPGMSTGAKVGIALGVLALGGGIVYAVTSGKKKKGK